MKLTRNRTTPPTQTEINSQYNKFPDYFLWETTTPDDLIMWLPMIAKMTLARSQMKTNLALPSSATPGSILELLIADFNEISENDVLSKRCKTTNKLKNWARFSKQAKVQAKFFSKLNCGAVEMLLNSKGASPKIASETVAFFDFIRSSFP